MLNTPSNPRSLQRGFTLVEMLVVAPLVILLIGTVIAYITTLTGESLQVREKEDMAFNIQAALDSIEGDSVKATRFLSTSGTLPSPQGKNNDFNGTTEFTSSDSLVLGVIATDKDAINPDRQPVFYANQPNPCGSDQTSNLMLITKAIYFVKDGSLWKRTIVPSYNNNSPADDFTVCNNPWQRNSCSPGQTATICKAEDEELVKNVSNFSVKYYANASSTTELSAADSAKAKTVDISITTQETAAGTQISQTGSIKVTRQNDIDADLVAPTTAPVVSYDINNTLGVTFNWDAIPNATSYKVSYSINGGAFNDAGTITNTSYTVSTTRKDTVTFRVAARNSYGVTATTQSTAQIPSTVACDMQNGWGPYGSVYGPATFTKTSAGAVTLNGLIKKSTTPTQYEVICNLPEGYRPSSKIIFAPATSGTTQARIDIETNGDVIYVYGNNAWISLNGINFLADGAVTWTNMTGSNGWIPYGGTTYAPPQAATDSTGRAWVQGLGKGGTTTAGTAAFNLPSAIPAMDGSDIYPARSSAVGSMQLTASKTVVYRGTGGNGYWSLQDMYYPNGSTTWSSPTLAAGWVPYSTTPGYNKAQYTKNADGIVSLRGLIKSGTVTNGTVLFTLPSQDWPEYNIICSVITYPDDFARVDVSSSGQVILREGVKTNWLSLAGCDFLATPHAP